MSADQPDCVVYLDGREVGRTSLSIVDLLPGPHKLQVWKSLFKPIAQTVWVRPNREERVSSSLKPVEHFTNSLDMEFVKIPAGSFMMGYRDDPDVMAAKGKDVIYPHEEFLPGLPRHRVEITKPFFMQTTEVTQQQYYDVIGEKYYYPSRPVTLDRVSEIDAFIAKLNERDRGKYRYRLPTEAEWEYACRAGTDSPFYTGETINPWQANYYYGNAPYGDGVTEKRGKDRVPMKVKSFPPNPWGLYDLHGNVWEVCADVYGPFFNTYADINDPLRDGPEELARTMRGGSDVSGPVSCLCGNKFYFRDKSSFNLEMRGFRLVAEKIGESTTVVMP
ncbi:MAG: SUMF1/EgtB/PvdO family nonheme iron enzyme [Pseudomonadota bacterium]